MSFAPLAGLVLAGGQSKRMGRDKAVLRVAGESLLDRAVRLLSKELADVRVAVRADQAAEQTRSRHHLIIDCFADSGPAAGILAAHQADTASAWLVVACDMPRLDAGAIAGLIAARDPQADATAWASPADGKPEPLCAIYEPGTLAAFLASVQAGGNTSPRSWLQTVRLRLLDAPDPSVLESANTPDELARLQDHMRPSTDGADQDEV